MNEDIPVQKPRRYDWIDLTWLPIVGLVLLSICSLMFPSVSSVLKQSPKTAARNDMSQIAIALKNYNEEYGAWLKGTHVEIIKTLRGDNLRKIVFLDFPDYKRGKSGLRDGRYVDPWGNPYIIDLTDPTNPKIYSFGKNGKDDHGKGDDIVNEESSPSPAAP